MISKHAAINTGEVTRMSRFCQQNLGPPIQIFEGRIFCVFHKFSDFIFMDDPIKEFRLRGFHKFS